MLEKMPQSNGIHLLVDLLMVMKASHWIISKELERKDTLSNIGTKHISLLQNSVLKKILQIGIGNDTNLAQFGENRSATYGIDATDKPTELTKKNFEFWGLSVEISKDDSTNISYLQNFFDGVYSFCVLHHIPK
jgi:hypothetical protein